MAVSHLRPAAISNCYNVLFISDIKRNALLKFHVNHFRNVLKLLYAYCMNSVKTLSSAHCVTEIEISKISQITTDSSFKRKKESCDTELNTLVFSFVETDH